MTAVHMQIADDVHEVTPVRFATACPSCGAELPGKLVQQEWLCANEIVELLDDIITVRVARKWLGTWSGAFTQSGIRGRVIGAAAFVRELEGHARATGRRAARPDARRCCSACAAPLDGVVVPTVYTTGDIAALLGAGFTERTVRRLVAAGRLPGFRIRGVRGLLVRAEDYRRYVAAAARAGARRPSRAAR